ncbi:hypothetical protein B7P34_21875 [Streptosporangium nondiastaticum]|uniref:Uncharacterized protein n=1 Tax=Streptosporangium nondiastaticum TaxID=35764 RepID=A0A9X7JN84_9ACTN|nr:hypothetical protein B7P34_21875 [Streptosporangium nondiastaticum]
MRDGRHDSSGTLGGRSSGTSTSSGTFTSSGTSSSSGTSTSSSTSTSCGTSASYGGSPPGRRADPDPATVPRLLPRPPAARARALPPGSLP